MTQTNPPGGFLDPDGWLERWLSLHSAPLITGEVARFAIRSLENGKEGSGSGKLQFTDLDREFEVDVEYVIENLKGQGLIFFLLGLRSPGDPLPSLGDV